MSAIAGIWRLAAGILVWGLHFALIYGGSALACARNQAVVIPWLVALATVAAIVACIAIILSELRGGPRFESRLAAGIAGMAMLAIAWEAVPVVMVRACVP